METESATPRRLGIPIDCTEHQECCTMSLDAFNAFARGRITVQRSLLPVGARLGAPLYVAGGFQDFELWMPKSGAERGVGAEAAPGPAAGAHSAPSAPGLAPDRCDTDVASLPTREEAPASRDAPEQLAPVQVVAPTGPVDRQLVATRLRSCPDDVRINGKIIPWGRTAPPRPPTEPRAPAPPIALEHVGDETLLRANGTRYRSADAEVARGIPLGAEVIVHRGEELRRLIAGADAFRLQLDLFTEVPPAPGAPQ